MISATIRWLLSIHCTHTKLIWQRNGTDSCYRSVGDCDRSVEPDRNFKIFLRNPQNAARPRAMAVAVGGDEIFAPQPIFSPAVVQARHPRRLADLCTAPNISRPCPNNPRPLRPAFLLSTQRWCIRLWEWCTVRKSTFRHCPASPRGLHSCP